MCAGPLRGEGYVYYGSAEVNARAKRSPYQVVQAPHIVQAKTSTSKRRAFLPGFELTGEEDTAIRVGGVLILVARHHRHHDG